MSPAHHHQGGGGSRKSDILLKTPLEPNLKRGGWGEFKGRFRCAGVLCAGRTPRPPKSPPTTPHQMKYIVSGTSKQWGMRLTCDPTIRTAPTNIYGRVSSAWEFPAMGTKNLGTVGLRGGHGVQNTPWAGNCSMGVDPHQGWSWGWECTMGLEIHHGVRMHQGEGIKEGVCV